MKRLAGLLAVVTLLMATSMSHMVWAVPGQQCTVTMCHVVTGRTLANGNTMVIGQVVEVSCASTPAHLGHGDMLSSGAVGSCCAFCITEEGEPCRLIVD